MRAAHCSRPGSVEIRESATPTPRSAGDVLVRVRRCGICGSDLHWYRGHTPTPSVCPGHEISGVVAAVGPSVSRLREGDRVVIEGTRSCGTCRACREGRTQLCSSLRILGVNMNGGFADYVLTHERHSYALPPAVMDDEVAQLAEPLAVGVHGLSVADFRPGQRVLVLGAGTIGLLGVTAAVEAGASEIVVSARRSHQREAALAMGAHRVLAPEDLQRTLAGPDEGGFEVVLDTVGDDAGRSLIDAFAGVQPGGAVVVLGIYAQHPPIDALRLMMHEIRLVGSMCYGRGRGRADFEVALDILARRGDFLGTTLITHRVALEDLDAGLKLAEDKTSGSIKVSVGISGAENGPTP